MDPIYIGAFGASLVLLAFAMGQFHVWKDTDFTYDFVNFLGAALLVFYAWMLSSWPFFVLNGVWAFISFRDCIVDLRRK